MNKVGMTRNGGTTLVVMLPLRSPPYEILYDHNIPPIHVPYLPRDSNIEALDAIYSLTEGGHAGIYQN